MIQQGSILLVCDKTGVTHVRCIRVLGVSNKVVASLNNIILVSILSINPIKFVKDPLKKSRFAKGTLHRALIVRSSQITARDSGSSFRFDSNSVILINENSIPLSNRAFGPIMKELCIKFLTVGSIVRYII